MVRLVAAFLFAILLSMACSTSSRVDFANADMVNVLVPAYANPASEFGPEMWDSLQATASDVNRHFDLHVIFNPASGPGSERDGNYLDDNGNGRLADFRNAGGKTHGYIATGFGSRDLNLVKADIDAYLTGHYQGFVDGLFFDEMANDLQYVGYYQQIADYVDSVNSNMWMFGNPGTTFTSNPSGQTDYSVSDYANVYDTLMSFENSGTEYTNNYTAPAYLASQSSTKFAHVIHSQENWDANLVSLAADRKAGFLYVTDDVMPNPYDRLASFWPDFTQSVSAYNAVPEPRSAGLLMLCAGGLVMRRRRQRI